MKLGAHCPNRRTSGPRAQIMRKSIFTPESHFSWNWVLTAQIGAQAVPELRSWENQFLLPNRNFHEIGCWLPKSAHKRCPRSDHEKINFYGRIAIFMKLGAHCPNRRPGGPGAQIMRKSIFTAESQFSWNWVLTAQIGAQAVPELRSWENQFLRPNRNFHEIGCSLPKSAHKRSPSSDHEKINFYGRITIFMKLGAHCPNRRPAQIGAQAVRELRSWENQFLRPNRNFHEIGCSLPKSVHKRSPSSDHEKINFYGRIAIFMKLGAHCSNRRTSGPRAQIMRKSIFTAESQFSWNWVLTAQIGAQAVPELRSWENQFLRPNRNFHEIGCSLFKSAHKRSRSSDHEKINFYGRIAIFMKLGAHCSNRRTSGPGAQIMRKSIFTAESQFSWNWVLTVQIGAQAVPELRSWENQFLRPNRNFHEIGCSLFKSAHKRSPSSHHEKINFYGRIAIFMKLGAHCPNRRPSGPGAQIMRKSIFTAESQFSWNWVRTVQIGAQAVTELRSWENQFLRPNRNFHEIGCSLFKSAHKRSPSSDHEKINFYGRIAIFMKLGAKCSNRRRSGPRAQIMRKSIFTAESQFSWNWVLTAQIGAKAVPELRSSENQFLLPNRNFHEIGCWLPKSAHKRSPSSDHEKINFYGRIALFMKLGAHCPNWRTSGPGAQIMRKLIFTAESHFSWNWVLTVQIGAQAVPELRSWENKFLRPNRNFHEIGCSLFKSAHKRSPCLDHEKINFYGRIAIFMKLGAHCPNRRPGGPGAQIMRKSIFTAESQFSWNWVLTVQIGAQAVPELRSWENQFLRPNRNFHEIGCSLFKSAHKRSPSSDHEKINFYGRIAIFMKLGAHCPNRRTSGPRAQIMRKSIFTAESQFSWNWVLTVQIGAQAVPELRSWENQFLRPNRHFHEIGCSLPKSAHKRSRSSDHDKIYFYGRIAIFMKLGAHCPNRRTSGPRAQIMRKSIFTAESQFSWNWVLTAQIGAQAVPELRSWENQFLRPNRNFHEIGCSLFKSAHKRSPSSDHEKINFYGRIAIFMKLGAHCPNRRTSGPRAQIMRKSIFTAESQFSWNWVLTAQIGAQAVPELRSWENQFLRPNRNFHEIGCSLFKSAHKRSPSSDHEKINFYGRIAIFMKLGAHCPNRRQAVPELRSWENQFLRPNRNFHEIGCSLFKSAHKRSPSSDHEKINFYGRIAIFMKLGAHCSNRRTSGPRAQIMRKSIFTAESQFSWNWVLTAQIGAQAVPELRSWENQFLRPNRNFHEIGCSLFKSAHKRSPSSDHEKINFYGRIAIFMKLGAHCPNRRTSGPGAQIMRKSIFTAESQFSWNWVLTAQIGAQAVPELRSWENQFLRPNRNFHEIGCSLFKSAHKRSPSSDHEKINFYGRIAIFMKLGAHCSNRRTSGPRAQIMRKSIFTAESQFSWNWVLTTQIGAQAVPELRSWENQFLRPNRNFHEIGCWLPKSAHKRSPSSDHEKINFYGRIFMKLGAHGAQAVPELRSWENQFLRPNRNFHEIGCSLFKSAHKRSPSSDHEKINFYGRIAIFMKLGAHCPNRRPSGPGAQIMRKSIFTAESQFSWNWVLTVQIGAQAVPELRSWENQFLRPNRNFHEIGCSLFKSAHKRSPSSDHEKINFYGRIAIFMKLGAHCPNRRTSGPRAQIMRKSIFTAESQFSWNWVLTAQIGAQAVPELRSWENQFLRPNRNFHEIGCSLFKSAHKRSPSSDHEKINFYGRIAIFMKLGAHYPNRRTSGPRAQIMRKSIFTAESQFSWNWVLTAYSNRRTSGPRAQIMRKSIFTAESQFSWNWVLTAQIGAQAVPELRSWENQFLRPNRNFHEIGCSLPKSAHKRSPSSDHEKINFYGRIAIFMKLGAHCPNRRTSGPRAQIMRKSIFTAESQFSWNWVLTAQIGAQAVPELRSWENQFLRPNRNFHEIGCSLPKSAHKRSPSSGHEKINFYGRIAIFMKLGAHCPNRRTSGPRAQIMRKSIFTAESQFSWNWVLTAQIGAQAVPELRSWENQFLRPNRNFHEIGCSLPKSAQKRSTSSDHEKINFYCRIAIFMKLGAHCQNRRTSGPRAQIMRKSIFTAESQFSWNWVLTTQIGAQAVPELRSWENQFLRPNRNFHEIGCSLFKSAHKRSPSSDHEKINFYGRIAIFMKLGAHCPNRRPSGPGAQIMRKSIFTAESQFSWNWVLTAQIGAQAVPELRSWENQFLRPNRNFHEIGCSLPKSAHKRSRSSDHEKIFMKLGAHCPNRRKSGSRAQSWENQFLRPNRNFHEIGCSLPKSAHKRSPSSDHEKINFYGRIAIFMKLGAHCPNRRTSGPRAQIMRKSIFTAESQFSWNWVLTVQIGAQAVPELRSWENQFLRPNRSFHEIGCSLPKSAPKRSRSSDHEKINFYGRIAIFMKLGAHCPNQHTSGPRPQIMRKSIFTAESQFSWNWVLTAQIGAQAVPELRSWENQFLRPNRNFHEIGCSLPKSAHKRSPSSDHEKINFYGRIALFMKLGAHCPNRRTSGPRAEIMRKSIFTAESQFSWNWVLTSKIGAQAVLELRSWENQFLRPNRTFHEIGCSLPKSAHKRSPSSDHEKINFYCRIAILMKLGADCQNRRTSGPRAQIMRKSIFTAESQFSWNWVLTAKIGAQAVPELRSWENQFLRPNRNFNEIGCSLPKSAHKRSPSSDHEKINFYGRIAISWNWVLTTQIGAQAVPELRSWENQFLRPNRNFHEIGCSLFKSAHKRSPSSDHEKINFYGRIAIFMKLGAHCPNRRPSGPGAQIMRKSIFTAESQFSWNWVFTVQIGAQAVPELRSWENQFLRPNRNFNEIGCSLFKSAHKRSPSSHHEKINFYGRIAIFMKLGAHYPNRRKTVTELRSWENQFLRPNRNFHEIGCSLPKSAHKRSPSSDHEKINFYGRIAIFMKLGAHCPNRRTSGPRAQIMRKSIFTAESQFSWNWVLNVQIGAQAVPELRSWENQFLRPNPNFHEIGCSLPKSAQKRSTNSGHEKINFYGRIAIFMKLGADCQNRRTSGPRAQIMRKSIFTAESNFMKLGAH